MMHSQATDMVLGVDGGGTRCRLALEINGLRHLVEVGPANASSGFDTAITEITKGLQQLADSAGLALAELCSAPAYLGLAGVTDDIVAMRVADALPLARVRITDDRPISLRASLGTAEGVLAHFGTGSFLAIQTRTGQRFAGGWGWRLGDEGSAYWIVREAFSVTLNAIDKVAPDTALTEHLATRFGGGGGIVAFCQNAAPGEIAALAPFITEHADAGDESALHIMNAGVAYIEGTARALGWTPAMALCLTGGLGPVYQTYLPEPLSKALKSPAGLPIDGALALAREFAGEEGS